MGVKFSIPGCFWVGKFGKYFFGVARSSLSIKIESRWLGGGGGGANEPITCNHGAPNIALHNKSTSSRPGDHGQYVLNNGKVAVIRQTKNNI